MEPVAIQSSGFYHVETHEENSKLMDHQDNFDSARDIV